MKTVALRLEPIAGPLVFQNELPRSDTVFGALVWAMKELGQDPKAFVDLYAQSPPLVVSSVFPCLEEGEGKEAKLVPLLLKPLYMVPGGDDFKDGDDYADYKKRKKARWMRPEGFNEAIAKGELPLELDKYQKGGETEERHRVRVPRLGGESELFHQRLVVLPGAWLALRGEDEWINKAKAGLKFLGERGLGGGASYGAGAFEIKEIDPPFQEVPDGNAWVSLSLYYPKDDEWAKIRDDPISAYNVERRKGRVDSSRFRGNVFKRPVLYMAEGSVLPWMDNPIPGMNVEVTPMGENKPVFGDNKPEFPVTGQGVALAVRAKKEVRE